MAYYLMIKKKNKYIPLDITSIPGFTRRSNFKDKYAYSLEEIDLCTSNYGNEGHFRAFLCKYGILQEEDINKEISIRFKKKDTL